MMIHKSTALIVLALIVPRAFLRVGAKLPAPLPGTKLEQFAGKVMHYLLYGLLVAMPVTGVAMGVVGGRGIPFYGLFTIPGWADPNKQVAGAFFYVHKNLGTVLEVAVPLHIGAVGYHLFKGQNILRRMGVGSSNVPKIKPA